MFISLDLVVGRFDQGKKPKREIELHSIELYRLPPRQSFGTLLQPPTLLYYVLRTKLLYISFAVSIFHGTEIEIFAVFFKKVV